MWYLLSRPAVNYYCYSTCTNNLLQFSTCITHMYSVFHWVIEWTCYVEDKGFCTAIKCWGDQLITSRRTEWKQNLCCNTVQNHTLNGSLIIWLDPHFVNDSWASCFIIFWQLPCFPWGEQIVLIPIGTTQELPLASSSFHDLDIEGIVTWSNWTVS